MKLKTFAKTAGAVLMGGVVATAMTSTAQAEFPEKPVKIMVGFSAGGGTDTTARGFASYVHEAEVMNGMPAVIINKPGGSGMVAAKIVKDGEPDGYTLYMINSGSFAAAVMSAKGDAPVDPRKDFTNLGCISQLVTALTVHSSSQFKSAADWVKHYKDSGETLRWSTSGPATMHALLGHLFLDTTGIKHQVIPFQGGSKARGALVAQKVDASFNGVHLTAGFENEIRVLGVPTAKRDPVNPDVPTFGEQGLPALNIAGPMCLWGPNGMPAETVAKLEAAVKHVSGVKGFGTFMSKSKLAAFHMTSEEGTTATNALFDTLQPVIDKIIN
ncbi:MAG: tripartite tricarboxylate transporter substrate binding protein [Rhodospirillales bacterium]